MTVRQFFICSVSAASETAETTGVTIGEQQQIKQHNFTSPSEPPAVRTVSLNSGQEWWAPQCWGLPPRTAASRGTREDESDEWHAHAPVSFPPALFPGLGDTRVPLIPEAPSVSSRERLRSSRCSTSRRGGWVTPLGGGTSGWLSVPPPLKRFVLKTPPTPEPRDLAHTIWLCHSKEGLFKCRNV